MGTGHNSFQKKKVLMLNPMNSVLRQKYQPKISTVLLVYASACTWMTHKTVFHAFFVLVLSINDRPIQAKTNGPEYQYCVLTWPTRCLYVVYIVPLAMFSFRRNCVPNRFKCTHQLTEENSGTCMKNTAEFSHRHQLVPNLPLPKHTHKHAHP